MSTENTVLMQMARESLRGKWGLAIGTFLIYFLVTGTLGSVHWAGAIFSIFITAPMVFGAATFSLAISRGREAKLEQLFNGFNYYWNTLAAYLLMIVYVFLWMLLLIVPGIIAALSYSMTFYILADDPSLAPQDALQMSKQMMVGYKGKLFGLFLLFFLLMLLCILTLGIGLLWLIPYMNVTMAKFYDDIRGVSLTEELI